MQWNYSQMTELFSDPAPSELLLDGKWGIEKESQRVTSGGDLALTGHPAVFGDKLTNPEITTDFSESQVEMITPPFPAIEDTYGYLTEIQKKVENGIGSELLWPLSMPPRLPDEEAIPIAKFDDSESGREKEIYRKGLALRYGKKMQMISGIHYNFSFGPDMMDLLYRQFGSGQSRQDFINDLYLAVTRNFLRHRWLLIYLFGASPSVDATYDPVICRELRIVTQCCPEWCGSIEKYKRYATSLRVSCFGYANPTRKGNHTYFNSLSDYTKNIRKLLLTKSRKYSPLGLARNGVAIQLNGNVLQKESEFYAPIRLKQITGRGETHLEALEKRGVRYLEVRILDLDPYKKVGVSLGQLYFLQAFMLFCLFEASKPISAAEMDTIDKNHQSVALFGRKPHLKLIRYGRGLVELRDWAGEIFAKLQTIAGLTDQRGGGTRYQTAVENELKKVFDVSLLPSARIQREMIIGPESFLDFGIRRAFINIGTQYDTGEDHDNDRQFAGNGAFHPNSNQGSAPAGDRCCSP